MQRSSIFFRKPHINPGRFVFAGVGTTKLDEINGEYLRDKREVRRHLSSRSLELRTMCCGKESCANGESGNEMTHRLLGLALFLFLLFEVMQIIHDPFFFKVR